MIHKIFYWIFTEEFYWIQYVYVNLASFFSKTAENR